MEIYFQQGGRRRKRRDFAAHSFIEEEKETQTEDEPKRACKRELFRSGKEQRDYHNLVHDRINSNK